MLNTPLPTNNLFDLFTVWLQGQINAAVQGHADRIERLEKENADLRDQLQGLARASDPLKTTTAADLKVAVYQAIDGFNIEERIDDRIDAATEHGAIHRVLDAFRGDIENKLEDHLNVIVREVCESVEFTENVRDVVNGSDVSINLS